LLLRSVDAGAIVEHLAIIGCHRLRPAPAVLSEAHRRAAAASLARQRVVATIEQPGGGSAPRVCWSPSTIETTIVIPVRNRVELLTKCVESLIRTVNPDRTRVVVADDESNEPGMLEFLSQLARDSPLRCRVLRVPRHGQAFNYARLVNAAAATVETPLMLHLNNDIEAIERGWLEQMAGWLDLDGVGVVGARLLAANGTVQHAGVFLREGHEPEHLFTGLEGDDAGYQSLAARARNVSAVTGACLLTRTELYRSLGGFDEGRFAVQFGDVDYCLRASDSGKRVVYEPAATLRHEGSATRGARYDPAENAAYIERHGHRRERFHSALLAASSLAGPTPLVAST
jgi:GT2 family glycosyltransferase